MFLKRLSEILVSTLYPDICAGCNDIIPEGEYFCDCCYAMLDRCETDKFCLKCGTLKKNCLCNSRVYHFDYCISPLYNSGVARHAMYKFKFRKKRYISEFFAKQMALCVKQCYDGVCFDGAVYVPIEKAKAFRRGYNQGQVLAEEISEILGIPVLYDALLSKGKKHTQHELKNVEERYENVKDVYYSEKNLGGKTLLLVDDIRTSGATLDACAKALLAAGADRVYCITGLMTDKKSKLKGKKNGN
ncbi:MAG: ComF family protein [Clostridia bacterium]|nr:ComF family protein [Clostridia bacterium]